MASVPVLSKLLIFPLVESTVPYPKKARAFRHEGTVPYRWKARACRQEGTCSSARRHGAFLRQGTCLPENGHILVKMRAYFHHFIFSFRSRVQSFRLASSGAVPVNIFAAFLSPLSCQSSHARATMLNSPPCGCPYVPP